MNTCQATQKWKQKVEKIPKCCKTIDYPQGLKVYGIEGLAYTVIRFVSISVKFGICTVLGLNGTLVEAKIHTWDAVVVYFSFKMCPTTEQMQNLALIETKRITVYGRSVLDCS
jgi:hypothetical protein